MNIPKRMTYKTRRHQVRGFLAEIIADCPEVDFTPKVRRKIASALKDAAMIGAAEERSRCLGIVKRSTANSTRAGESWDAEQICSVSVLAVLGW